MDLAASDEGGFTLTERLSHIVLAGNPAFSRKSDEELPETGLMSPDHSAGVEVEHESVSFSVSCGDLDRGDVLHRERPFPDRHCSAGV